MQLVYSHIELAHMVDGCKEVGNTRGRDLLSLFPHGEFWRRKSQNLLGGVEVQHGQIDSKACKLQQGKFYKEENKTQPGWKVLDEVTQRGCGNSAFGDFQNLTG